MPGLQILPFLSYKEEINKEGGVGGKLTLPPSTTTTQIRFKKGIFLIEWSKVLNKVKVPPSYFVKLRQITFRIHDVERIHFFTSSRFITN